MAVPLVDPNTGVPITEEEMMLLEQQQNAPYQPMELSADHAEQYNQVAGQYDQATQRARESDQLNLEALREKLARQQSVEQGLDVRPLAALLDQWNAGAGVQSNNAATAQGLADTYAKRDGLETATEEQIRALSSGMNKDQLRALKDRLTSLGRIQTAGARLEAASGEKQKNRDATWGRFNKKQVKDYGNFMSEVSDLEGTMSLIEGDLGFDVNDYDFETNTVKGMDGEVDIPGTRIPGYGGVSVHSPQARRLDNTIRKLFNMELSDRSGAAVTESELKRLREEFSDGNFQTEPEIIQAIQDYKRLLERRVVEASSGFDKNIRDRHAQNIREVRGERGSKRISTGAPKKTAAPSGPGGAMSFEQFMKNKGK